MKNAHVVHVTTVHRAFDTRIFQKECRSLAETGYRVTLIARHSQREAVDDVEIIPLPRYKNRAARMLLGTWAAFRLARRQQANIYHLHDPELLPIGVLLKLTTRGKVIHDVHENYAQKVRGRAWLPRPLRRIASLTVRLVEAVCMKRLDGIVVVTENIARQFAHPRIVIVKNYPLLSATALSAKAQTARNDNYSLIYTGGLTYHRGIYQVVQALALVEAPDARLIIVGRSDGPSFEAEISALPGYDKVEYLGLVSFKEAYQSMSSAAIGFVCNQPTFDYELAQPNKLFEYMSIGLPVVASHFDLWKDVVEGNECGLTVDPTRPEQIARASDYLLSRPELRRRMGENGRMAVKERYNWQAEYQKLASLYQEVLGQ